MAAKRKYPVGVQSFESLRKDGYLYIDKTPLVYKFPNAEVRKGFADCLFKHVAGKKVDSRNITDWQAIPLE